ncbi:hydroxyacylglutathione hydrolase [Gilvimarinus polysaccharolyticus]|uniref:hydroxyacylglutathione hydrolase n=1 Tax=Gilvimarinus polysaccharolyticus TaxID=863921 RepID=UPI0006734615|nr:hydroxyacylglutathione hydrolase [Gilvimarinus polysaccharolyticus]
MQIYHLPALETNYFWLLQPDADRRDAYIFDPGDAAPVIDALKRYNLTLAGIVLTHHHWDHTDGIDALLEHHSIPVYGPISKRIPQVTHPLTEGDSLDLGSTRWSILATPGHTLDHIVYYCANTQHATQPSGVLIAGDTIFAGGCGRMFEGTPEMFLQSLNKIAQLPNDTVLYCSHEYTLANLAFAQAVEPNNPDIAQRLTRERRKREQKMPTLPSSIGLELATNPFVRCQQPTVINSANSKSGQVQTTPADVFAVLRAWKNDFPAN